MGELYQEEFKEMGYQLAGPLPGGPMSMRFAIQGEAYEEARIAEIVMGTSLPLINMMCHNSVRMKSRTDDQRVMELFKTGWLEDGSYFQITSLPISAATLAESQARQRWNEIDFWLGARDLLGALFHLHRREIVHAAFSPWTVYKSQSGICLADFWWIHNVEGSSLYEDLAEHYLDILPLGFLPFTAPEVLSGVRPSRESDMWSLGAVLFYTLSGTLPRRLNTQPPENASGEQIRQCWATAQRFPLRQFCPKLDPVVMGVVESLMEDAPHLRLNPFDLEGFIMGNLERLALV